MLSAHYINNSTKQAKEQCLCSIISQPNSTWKAAPGQLHDLISCCVYKLKLISTFYSGAVPSSIHLINILRAAHNDGLQLLLLSEPRWYASLLFVS